MMATRSKRPRRQERLDQDLKSIADESSCPPGSGASSGLPIEPRHTRPGQGVITTLVRQRGWPAFKVRGFIVRSLGRFLLCRVLNLGCNSVLMGDLGRDSLLPGVNG